MTLNWFSCIYLPDTGITHGPPPPARHCFHVTYTFELQTSTFYITFITDQYCSLYVTNLKIYIIFIYLLICVVCVYVVCVSTHGCAVVCVWKSEDNLQESVLSFHHVGSKYDLRSLGLASGTFIPCATSMALHYAYICSYTHIVKVSSLWLHLVS